MAVQVPLQCALCTSTKTNRIAFRRDLKLEIYGCAECGGQFTVESSSDEQGRVNRSERSDRSNRS